MGFMDKAKKLAEQAQQKLDEAQSQFNQNPSRPEGGGVQYDEHGRPIPQAPPATTAPTPDPAAPPAGDRPGEVPASPSAPAAPASEEHADEPPTPPPPAPSSGANPSPDPFKPLQ
jgi:hypothetical protein